MYVYIYIYIITDARVVCLLRLAGGGASLIQSRPLRAESLLLPASVKQEAELAPASVQ